MKYNRSNFTFVIVFSLLLLFSTYVYSEEENVYCDIQSDCFEIITKWENLIFEDFGLETNWAGCEEAAPSMETMKEELKKEADRKWKKNVSLGCPSRCECEGYDKQPEGWPKISTFNRKVRSTITKVVGKSHCTWYFGGTVTVTITRKLGQCAN